MSEKTEWPAEKRTTRLKGNGRKRDLKEIERVKVMRTVHLLVCEKFVVSLADELANERVTEFLNKAKKNELD